MTPLSVLGFALLLYDAQKPPPPRRGLQGFGRLDPGEVAYRRALMEAPLLEQVSPGMVAWPRAARGDLIRNVGDLHQRAEIIRKTIVDGSKDPEVRKLAAAVLARRCTNRPGGWCVAEKDWRGEAVALHAFVRKNMRYTRDNALADTFVTPRRTLFDRHPRVGAIGDCDDFTITLGALLASVGHSVSERIGAIRNDPKEARPPPNHIWLVDYLPIGGAVARAGEVTFPLDASVDKPAGWEAPRERIYKAWTFKVT